MVMNDSQGIRRSDRRRIRPVEFWNFVKPEESVNETITYNESELSRCSVFRPFSCSYRRTPKRCFSSFKENMTKVPKTAEKKDDLSTLTVQNATHTPRSLGRKRRLVPLGKVNSHSLPSSEDPAHSAKLSRKAVRQELTGKTSDYPSLGDHEQTHSSRLADKNQNLADKEPSWRDDSTRANGEGTAHTPKRVGKKRKLEGNSALSSDASTASQKKRGRKQKHEHEEPQTETTGNIPTLCDEDLRRKVPQTRAREKLEHPNKQDSTRVGLTPNNSSKHPTSFLSSSRDHYTRSIHQARDATNTTTGTTTKVSLTGRDTTQNTTTFEQPSFQNVFSSTAIDAPGKDVFKVPRLPSFRRPPLSSLKVSSMCLDPSMVTIPEEEEGEEHQDKKKEQERQKNKKHEKEKLLKNRKKQEDEKQQKNELEKQELQVNREEQEQEQEKNKEEEQVQQKNKKQMDGVVKVPVRGGEKSTGDDSGVGSDNGDATATVTAGSTRTGASLRETSQEKTSAAVPSQPQGEESRGNPAQEDTRTEVSQNWRRSSRVRMKPLEFWNFEKVEVERQQDGEVHIIHQKQDPVQQSINTRIVDCSMACRSQLGHGVTLTTDLLGDTLHFGVPKKKNRVKETTVASPSKGRCKISPIKSMRDKKNINHHPALSPSQGKRRVDTQEIISSWSPNRTPTKSPSKKKLFSPHDDFLDKPVEEGNTFRRRTKGGMMVVQMKKFQDMQFMVIEREAYRCYLAQGLQIKDQSIYTGYIFLEHGQIVWNTTRKTTLYVIDGYGNLKCINEDCGLTYSLKPRQTLEFKKRLKLSVKKDGRCKLLKLHIVLGPHL